MVPAPPICRPKWHLFVLEAFAVLFLLALYYGLAIAAIERKSITFDELAHLTNGYSRWQTGDFHFPPENGLPQAFATLPLLMGSWAFPSLDNLPWSQTTNWNVGTRFLFHSGNDADAILKRARAMIAVLAVTLGLIVYGWSRRLFGRPGALISLTMFATCPTMLALGPLVTADLACALFFTASAWALWHVLHRITLLTVLLSSLAVSGLFLSKISAVVFIPAGLVMGALRVAVGPPLLVAWPSRDTVVARRASQTVVLAALVLCHVAVVWASIWAFCGFRYEAIRPGRPTDVAEYQQEWPRLLAKPGLVMQAIGLARHFRLLPEAYLYTHARTIAESHTRVSFLNGDYSIEGHALFFPYCLLVKTSPALMALLALAAAAGVARIGARGKRAWGGAYHLTPLAVILVVYWAFALASNLNIGHRHLLPTYPAMYILAGGAALWLVRPLSTSVSIEPSRRQSWPAFAIALCLFAATVDALWTWPHYLAYFNRFAGGPENGYRHLVDSSLDWGQDLKELACWLRTRAAREKTGVIYLSYFGTGDPQYYGIDAVLLPSFFPVADADNVRSLTGGTYCISATMLQGIYCPTPLFRGAWGQVQETCYRDLLATGRQLAAVRANHPSIPDKIRKLLTPAKQKEFREIFEEARFARLCAALRKREPNAQVGFSILIYSLTDAEVQDALWGPPP